MACLFAANLRFVTMFGVSATWPHPVPALQESMVQALASSQLVGACGQVPVFGSQVSSVHRSASAQLIGVWPQTPALQVSVVQPLLSLQSAIVVQGAAVMLMHQPPPTAPVSPAESSTT